MYPFPSQPHPHFQHPDNFPSQPPQQPSQQPQHPPQEHPTSNQPPRERDQSRDSSHPTSHRVIGEPLNFSTGQFSGKHVRAQLIELQKADLGRKHVLTLFLSHPTLIHTTILDMLARIAGLSIHHLSSNSNFSTRIPAPTDLIQKSRITSCASCLLVPFITPR